MLEKIKSIFKKEPEPYYYPFSVVWNGVPLCHAAKDDLELAIYLYNVKPVGSA